MEDKRGDKTWTKAERWEVEDGVADFLYGLVRAVKPERVLDVGTYKGKSAIAMARALRENGRGRLTTVDDDRRSEYFDRLMESGVSYLIGSTIGKSPKVLHELNLEGLGLAFLDTDHTYDTVLGELEVVDKHLKIGGYIAVHDSLYPDHCENVLEACDRFMGDHPEYTAVNIDSYAGVFLMKKCLVGESFVWNTIRFVEEVTSDGVE